MDTRSLELLHAAQRIIAVVERHDDLHRLAAESTAFELFKEAIADLEAWEERRNANETEIKVCRARTDAALDALLLDLACVQLAAQLTPTHVAPLPKLTVPSKHDHVERIISAANGMVTVARENLPALTKSGMHPGKLAHIESAARELDEVHLRWAMAEGYSSVFPDLLVQLKDQLRKRGRQLELELASAMSREARAEWKLAASLGRKHRPIARRSEDITLPAPQPMKLLPPVTDESAMVAEDASAAKKVGRIAGRALAPLKRVIGNRAKA